MRSPSHAALLTFAAFAHAASGGGPGAEPHLRYRLSEPAVLYVGCIEGCACPVSIVDDIRGRFELTFLEQNPLYSTYSVSNLEWLATIQGVFAAITGDGEYLVGGEFASMHGMDVTLTEGDGDPAPFESGFVVGGQAFPDAIQIDIQMAGVACVTRAVTVVAERVVFSYSDLDNDGDVDGADLAILLGRWGTNDVVADITIDGVVDGVDLARLLGDWSPPPG